MKMIKNKESYHVLGWELSEFFEYDAQIELSDIFSFLSDNVKVFEEWSKRMEKTIGFVSATTGRVSFINDVTPSVAISHGTKLYIGYIQKAGILGEIDARIITLDGWLADLFVKADSLLFRAIASYFLVYNKKQYLVGV